MRRFTKAACNPELLQQLLPTDARLLADVVHLPGKQMPRRRLAGTGTAEG